MSQYSGKCDFADEVSIFGIEQILKNSIVYVNNIGPLKFESEKDLVPYYPYIVGMAVHNKENGSVIHLSRESFVDREENERLEWILTDTIKEYKKAKRNKSEFTIESVKRRYMIDNALIKIIYDRVKTNGIKANTKKLHTPIHNYYRCELLEEAKRLDCENHPLIIELKEKINEFNAQNSL